MQTFSEGVERTGLLATETHASPVDLVESVGGSRSQSDGRLERKFLDQAFVK